MTKERHLPAISYLIEIIVSILFFALASVICVTIMYQASLRSEKSVIRQDGLLYVQEYIEQAIASQQPIEDIEWYVNKEMDIVDMVSTQKVSVSFVEKENSCYTYKITLTYKEEELIDMIFVVNQKGGLYS